MIGHKADDGKPPWHLLPMDAVEEVVKVLGHGAAKYGEHNWRYVDRSRDRYFSAALRHLAAWQRGELTDSDSGLPHLAHAACSLLFLLSAPFPNTSKDSK